MRCPICGKFVSDCVAIVNGNNDIIKVEGKCKIHGIVNPDDWEADDFIAFNKTYRNDWTFGGNGTQNRTTSDGGRDRT